MKHDLKVTVALITLFLASQIIGIAVAYMYIDPEETARTGQVTYNSLPYGLERPEVEQSSSYIFILISLLIATLILLVLVRFRKGNLWRLWFFSSAVLCLAVSLSAFINSMVAVIASIALAFFKVFKPNIVIHNLTELFMYGGLAAIFVPIMNLFAAIMLLIVVAFYDMFAVWQSKHMIRLARFQTQSRVFAGIFIPYRRDDEGRDDEVQADNRAAIGSRPDAKAVKTTSAAKQKHKTREGQASEACQACPSHGSAIIGGGDIGLPILFAGVAMKSLGLLKSLVIPLFVTAALLALLVLGKRDRFYPAIPFITAGCLIGYAFTRFIL